MSNPRGSELPSLAEMIGGPRGVVEAALPAIAFVLAYTISGSQTTTAAGVAVSVAIVLATVRLVQRESPVQALSGLVGVGVAAFIAARSGKAENFFLPGLLLNAAYATAFIVSIAIRRPLVGLVVGRLEGEDAAATRDPLRRRVYTRASWLWAGLFLTRLAVQLPLYLAGAVVALGIARTAMGLPLIALGLWLTYLLVRRRVQ